MKQIPRLKRKMIKGMLTRDVNPSKRTLSGDQKEDITFWVLNRDTIELNDEGQWVNSEGYVNDEDRFFFVLDWVELYGEASLPVKGDKMLAEVEI